MLRVERGGLLTEIDVPGDLADSSQDGEVGDAMRIGKCPERRLEAGFPNGLGEPPCVLQTLAVDERNVRAYRRVFGDIAIERIGDFHHVALGGELLRRLPRLP